jgi:predicted O-linked N-acetylglucosamine transferase (SPINDLY family)
VKGKKSIPGPSFTKGRERYMRLINLEQIRHLINEKNYQLVCLKILEIFQYYASGTEAFNEEELKQLKIFILDFLDLFCSDIFIVPPAFYSSFISLNYYIAIFVSITELKNTDIYIKKLPEKNIYLPEKIIKLFTLLSATNTINADYKLLFEINPELASQWYWAYFSLINYISEYTCHNLKNHVDQINLIGNKLSIEIPSAQPSYLITYLYPEKEKILKEKINLLVREKYRNIIVGAFHGTHLQSNNSKKKIAIISGLLIPGHAVYKGTWQFVQSLSEEYDLTMVHLRNSIIEQNEITFEGIFKEVIYLDLSFSNLAESIEPFLTNNFDLIFYPDIGMTAESIVLSNLRLAPLQVTAHGHSVSTRGAEIDYFISGTESEEIGSAEKNYSERLVLIPGTGLQTSYREPVSLWIGQRLRLPNPENKSDFIIICPWSRQKINKNHLLNLQKIKAGTKKNIIFQFFTSFRDLYIDVFAENLADLLGKESVKVFPALTNKEYLSIFEAGDISIDSFHFGGYNTVIDALYLGKPVITLEGKHAYNKFAAALFRKAGLQELIASNENDYIEKILKLVNNEAYFENLTRRLKNIDLKTIILENSETVHFKKAIAYLLENHERLKAENSRKPIKII